MNKKLHRSILNHLKNLPGWRTNRRLVVINVDDYGNVRLASKGARASLEKAGVINAKSSRFDLYDSLETREDLEALFEVLTSVQDKHGNPAVFTAYALSANPDFKRILDESSGYQYENLPNTFERLSREQAGSYGGAWDLWKEGIDRGLLMPQFHGREHFHVASFEAKLARKDLKLISNLQNRCVAGLSNEGAYPNVGFTQAFGSASHAELPNQREILKDGLKLFKNIFGFDSVSFTPPAAQLHPTLYSALEANKVRAIHKAMYRKYRGKKESTKVELNWLGKKIGQSHLSIVRNVVFEPTDDRGYDPVTYAVNQIHAAFRCRKPAMISTHRVNFCGHIEPGNRGKGLTALRQLLANIVELWPDVEFISASQLVSIIGSD